MGAKFRAAVIGAGEMANKVHYPSLHALEDVDIVGICDIDADRLNRTTSKYGIERTFTDYQTMVREIKPDAVYAIGNPHTMYDIWMWCLNQGCHLYIEKPLGITIHQARALAHTAEANGCITQVSFQRRITPMVVHLRDEVLRRGPIVHAVCKFYKSNIEPFLGARDHMMDDTVHSIDTLRWICGGEVTNVESFTKRVAVPDINFISATLQFDNGATGFLINSWSSGKRIFSVEMHAPNVYAEAEHEGKGYLYADGDLEGVSYDSRAFAGSDAFHVYGGFQAKHREFIDCVRANVQPASNFMDALKTMEVAETILAQSLLGGR